ncbi:MAG TPA: argininosuccinate lyase [Acidobacteriaceae bacterium]
MKMWSGRFREPLDARFEEWQRSFGFDWQLLPQEIAASKAHASVLAAAGILSAAECTQVRDGLDAVLKDCWDGPRRAALAADSRAEDVHHFVELELTEHIGELALKLHTGRSRNEQIATDLRLYVRDQAAAAQQLLRGWAVALIGQAENASDAIMPAYTHLQRAEPVLVAHWLLAYVSMIERDISRLADLSARLNYCPLGSGAIAGATLALDRTIAACELGFTAPTVNSMDATSDRDFLVEFLQALSTVALHTSRFAEEITLFATAEFGFIALPESFSTGSSAMPQKMNPDLTELVRGRTGRIVSAANGAAMQLKGLPLAYNKDLQEMQPVLFDAVTGLLPLMELLAPFTQKLSFRLEHMEKAAQSGFLNAMAAATYLSHRGVPFRRAHHIIGQAVRLAIEKGCELDGLTLDELQQLSSTFAEDFYASITLDATVDCHDVIGGTARARVHEAVASAKARLAAVLVPELEAAGAHS